MLFSLIGDFVRRWAVVVNLSMPFFGRAFQNQPHLLIPSLYSSQAFDKVGGTALHIAAFAGNQEAVKVLIKVVTSELSGIILF